MVFLIVLAQRAVLISMSVRPELTLVTPMLPVLTFQTPIRALVMWDLKVTALVVSPFVLMAVMVESVMKEFVFVPMGPQGRAAN